MGKDIWFIAFHELVAITRHGAVSPLLTGRSPRTNQRTHWHPRVVTPNRLLWQPLRQSVAAQDVTLINGSNVSSNVKYKSAITVIEIDLFTFSIPSRVCSL